MLRFLFSLANLSQDKRLITLDYWEFWVSGKSGYWSVKSIFLISSFLLALHLSSARKTDVLWQGADMKYIPNKSTLVLIPYGYISIHWANQPLVDIFVKSLIKSTHKVNWFGCSSCFWLTLISRRVTLNSSLVIWDIYLGIDWTYKTWTYFLMMSSLSQVSSPLQLKT